MDTIHLIQIWATELAELSKLLSSKPKSELDKLMHFWFTDLMRHHVCTVVFFCCWDLNTHVSADARR